MQPPPLLTADLPGIGGRIKVEPEDFEVEEVPSYEPSGAGEHLYLWVEKRDVGPEFFARTIAQRLGIHAGDGRHRRAEGPPRRHPAEGVRAVGVRAARPGNSTATGSRAETRPGTPTSSSPATCAATASASSSATPTRQGRRVARILDALGALGTAELLRPAAVRPRRRHGRARLAVPRRHRAAAAAARSSASSPSRRCSRLLFNDYLGRRMADGLFRTVLPGDVMAKWPFGGLFVAEDVAGGAGAVRRPRDGDRRADVRQEDVPGRGPTPPSARRPSCATTAWRPRRSPGSASW